MCHHIWHEYDGMCYKMMRTIIQIFQGLFVTLAGLILLYALGAIYKYGIPIVFVSERMFFTIVGGSIFSFFILLIVQNSHDKLMRTKILEQRAEQIKKEN